MREPLIAQICEIRSKLIVGHGQDLTVDQMRWEIGWRQVEKLSGLLLEIFGQWAFPRFEK